jgi:hypothetical protein
MDKGVPAKKTYQTGEPENYEGVTHGWVEKNIVSAQEDERVNQRRLTLARSCNAAAADAPLASCRKRRGHPCIAGHPKQG